MKELMFAALMAFFAAPLFAQHRVDVLLDAEGVHRPGGSTDLSTGVHFDPQFGTGGGVGLGLNFFLTDRVSIEAKAAALESQLKVRTIGSDFFAVADLGRAQIYPITALLQWHLSEHGTIRPYLGAGIAHVVLRNINHSVGSTDASGIHFKDPTGLVVDGGLEAQISKRWSILGDARYIPIETKSEAAFIGTSSSVRMNVRPLIVSAGLSWRF
ncbi:MAG TPA: OmpW family outer membrane protein [Thermoanaerobaculia bacterium]|nr:OmpW family outer membrane protein [Thermoanaerobaculia bacterium]